MKTHNLKDDGVCPRDDKALADRDNLLGVDGKFNSPRYKLLSGIELVFNHYKVGQLTPEYQSLSPELQIDYCFQGVCEYQFCNQPRRFFAKNSISVTSIRESFIGNFIFPFGSYDGLTIFIDPDEAQRALDSHFPMANILFREIFQDILYTTKHHTLKNDPILAGIMEDIYTHEQRDDRDFWILKIIELFMYLRDMDIAAQNRYMTFSPSVYEATKLCCVYIHNNPLKDLSVDVLADKFCLSKSSLRRCFHQLTGENIGTYVQRIHMDIAADLLAADDELTIGQIANKVGYINQSKFSAAFKRFYGQTPSGYRKNCRETR